MTTAFVVEANKLKNIQINLEKSENILIDHLSKQEDGSKLNEFYEELEITRARDLELVRNEIRNIYSPLNKLKTQITGDNIQNIDLNMLKKDMVSVQNNIQNMRYKHKMMLEKLAKEEKELLAEMHAFEEKLAQWDNRAAVIQNTHTQATRQTGNASACPEVTEFLKFVMENGGHEGGWPTDDHNMFIKIRSKYKNANQMANCIHALCPDLSIEDILKHEEWYVTFLKLKEKQKQAIKIWRESKNKAKQNEEAKQNTIKPPLVKNTKKDTVNKEQIQVKINSWKTQKEQEQLAELEAKKKREIREKENEEKKKQKVEELKMEVSRWKHDKTLKRHEENLKKEIQELKEREYRKVNSKKLIKQFQSHDDFYIERMKKARKPRPKSLERPPKKNTVPRDPERLLKPTKQWIFRTMPKRSDEEINIMPKPVCNVKFVQKLGVPSWRKCI